MSDLSNSDSETESGVEPIFPTSLDAGCIGSFIEDPVPDEEEDLVFNERIRTFCNQAQYFQTTCLSIGLSWPPVFSFVRIRAKRIEENLEGICWCCCSTRLSSGSWDYFDYRTRVQHFVVSLGLPCPAKPSIAVGRVGYVTEELA
jgi:hypothetical protein